MSLKWPTVIAMALTAAATSGCATSEHSASSEDVGRECLQVRSINSFTALDDNHLVVTARVNDHYVFTLDPGCRGVRFAQRIAISDPALNVCGDGFSSVVFREPGMGPRRCRILDITAVEDLEAAERLLE